MNRRRPERRGNEGGGGSFICAVGGGGADRLDICQNPRPFRVIRTWFGGWRSDERIAEMQATYYREYLKGGPQVV